MENEPYRPLTDNAEFGEFANFFIKYLNGSSNQNEAFIRARCTYRKLFKKIPYSNFQSFMSEFSKSQDLNSISIK